MIESWEKFSQDPESKEKKLRGSKVELDIKDIKPQEVEEGKYFILVNLQLGERELQIIQITDENGNCRYFLIDPEVFKYENFNFREKPGTAIEITNRTIVLGSLKEKDLDLTHGFNFPATVSSQHLVVGLRNGKLIIRDLNSTNGTIIEYIKKNR